MKQITTNLRNKCGVYMLINLSNGKRYIGSSCNLYNRLHEHLYNLKTNKSHNKHLQSSWNKYGEGCFSYEILEYCDIDIQFEREQWYISEFKPEYNFSLQVVANTKRKLTDIEKQKISNTLKQKYANKEIIAYNQIKKWETVYVYNIDTFCLEYSAPNKKLALEYLSIKSNNRKYNSLIKNKYILSKYLYNDEDLKEFIIKNVYFKGKYKVVEYNSVYYYFRTVNDCINFCNCTRKQYSINVWNKNASKDNPWIYNDYKIFETKDYLGLLPS